MGILRNYINNGVPVANRIKFESDNKPLVVKNVPLVADAKVPTYTTEASRRLTDLERVAKLMIKPEGLKFLANNAALKQLQFKTDTKKKPAGRVLERVGQGLADTAKLIGSTLAQTPVNGTGIHFVQSFAGIKGTYLEKKGQVEQGGVPPHVMVSPGFAPLFIKEDSDRDKQLTGKVPISTANTKKNESVEVDGQVSVEGPAGKLYSTKPKPGSEFVGATGTYNADGTPIAQNTAFGGITGDDEVTEKDEKATALPIRINLGDPGLPVNDENESLRQDQINLLGPSSEKLDGTKEARDLIKFRIEVITPGDKNSEPKIKYLYFRAYLDSFSDGFSGKWNSYNYVGRAENFYTYQGTDRNINVGFKISAQSSKEMRPLYQKLNVLASSTTPTYDNNFMRGTLVKLTVGDYLYRQPGFIEKVDFKWDKDYPWEIAMQRPEGEERDIPHQELPTVLDVSIGFTPIHNFIPTSQYTLPSTEQIKKGEGVVTGPRYISFGSDKSKNRYIKQSNE